MQNNTNNFKIIKIIFTNLAPAESIEFLIDSKNPSRNLRQEAIASDSNEHISLTFPMS